MQNKKSDTFDLSQPRQMALSRWDNEGGALRVHPDGKLGTGAPQTDIPQLTNAELVQLRVRVIALENLVIALLADASDRQIERVRELAAYISPRPGFTHHPLTIHGAAHMVDLVERSSHFRVTSSS